MKLSELLNIGHNGADIEIFGIAADSREVKRGYLFVALPGLIYNGADFIDDAIDAGASAILSIPKYKNNNNNNNNAVVWITNKYPSKIFPKIVSKFFNLQPENIAAVTGTNGKTSVSLFTQQIWEKLDIKAASLGTLGIQSDNYQKYTGLTTPDPIMIHRSLSDLYNLGVNHVVIEASSHGLDQRRLDGLNISASAFTNLTHDHLDYHKTEAEYLNAKKRLFSDLMRPSSTAVINIDSPFASEIQEICISKSHKIITVGKSESNIRLLNQRTSLTGQKIAVVYEEKIYEISLPLVGHFQAINALMAVGLVIGCGGNAVHALETLSQLQPVRGRMELAGRHPNGATIFVDYAHTPDALKTVLQALKPHTKNELKVIFGCGGNRDKAKRKIMGKLACNLADQVYVTDDNPRSENPSMIRNEILKECPGGHDVGERLGAIKNAVSDLKPGDILLIAGKGHEQGQVIGNNVINFDDVSVVCSTILALEKDEIENKKGLS